MYHPWGNGPEGEDVWSQGRMALRPLWWTYKHLWKHYLPATSFAGGKYWRQWKLSIFRKLRDMPGTNYIWQLNLTTKDSAQLINKAETKIPWSTAKRDRCVWFAHPCFIMIFKYLTDNLVLLTYIQLLSHKWVGFHSLLHLSHRVSVQVTFGDSFSVLLYGKGEVLFKNCSYSGTRLPYWNFNWGEFHKNVSYSVFEKNCGGVSTPKVIRLETSMWLRTSRYQF